MSSEFWTNRKPAWEYWITNAFRMPSDTFSPLLCIVLDQKTAREPLPRGAGTPWSGAFALDTKTGQLCFTYNTNTKGWDGLPQCLQLLKDYPDAQAAPSSPATDATVQKLLDKYK